MVDTVCHGRLRNNLNCPLLPFDVLVRANVVLNITVAIRSKSKHLKATADVQTEGWTKTLFHPLCNTTGRHFYRLVLRTCCAAVLLSSGTRDICRTKIFVGHSVFFPPEEICQAPREWGLWLSNEFTPQCSVLFLSQITTIDQ